MLDEPTGDLDTRNTDKVMKILCDLNRREKITMVMVTHDVALKGYASKIVRMYDGKVANIEFVDEEEREMQYAALNEKITRIERGEDVGVLNVREGIEEGVENFAANRAGMLSHEPEKGPAEETR